MEHLNPREVRIVALDKPTERELTQWCFQRYVARLAAAGRTTLFDRCWYNRAYVEQVMGSPHRRRNAKLLARSTTRQHAAST
jgi:polyphosphate kinase 2 (PPK2 family)